MSFDVAISESEGNGGDLQLVGSDLAVVFDVSNMVYLAFFGGNVEESTVSNSVNAESLDFWGNTLFLSENPSSQFNSETERSFKTNELTSAGRINIENAMKKDLEFLQAMGVKFTVECIIADTDRLETRIRYRQNQQAERIIIINFKKQSDGDFFIQDFNDDFLV